MAEEEEGGRGAGGGGADAAAGHLAGGAVAAPGADAHLHAPPPLLTDRYRSIACCNIWLAPWRVRAELLTDAGGSIHAIQASLFVMSVCVS